MSNRLLRVNELLQREISAFLHSRYSGESVAITITGVEITGDLREAKVYYSVLGEESEAARAGKWLLRHRGEIREPADSRGRTDCDSVARKRPARCLWVE